MRSFPASLASCLLSSGLTLAAAAATDPASALEPDAAWLGNAQRWIAEREYRVSASAAGLQAPNRAHELRAFFDPSGIRVHDRRARGGSELLRLSLAAVGRGAALTAAAAPVGEPVVHENRVEIRRPGLVEWYVNSAAGLEQGFTLAERPAGEGPLALELVVAGATASLRGEAVVFASAAQRRLRFGELAAEDASGRTLATRFELPSPERLRIVVDDAGARYPVVIDPLLSGIDDGELTSDQSGAELGVSVAGAGDVNGDGYADVIVGTPSYDAGDLDEGAAFVFHGSAAGVADAGAAGAAAQLESDQLAAELGRSVAGAGDVNGDGYADVIVGAPFYENGASDEGAAFVFLGGAGGIAGGTPGTAATRIESEQAFATLGNSVAGAGDVNGDGFADVIVAARFYDAGEPEEGAAFVFHGSATGVADGTPSTADAQLESDQIGAFFGASVASAGDVNGDGFADVIVGDAFYDSGEVDEGAAFVFHGSATGVASGNSASAATRLQSDQADAQLGTQVAGAGDVNGDGYADVIVGAPLYDNPLFDGGSAFVLHGSAAGIADATPASVATSLDADGIGARFGTSVARAGDVNGDGYSDVVVGAPLYDYGQVDEGAAVVFVGSAGGIVEVAPSAALLLQANQASSRFGESVAGAGDVNGDGYADVIAGAPAFDAGESDEGAAFVFLGEASGIADGTLADAASLLETDQAEASLQITAASAGDVNGDGYGDVIVGVPSYSHPGLYEGAAFIFHGSENGIPDASMLTADTVLDGAPVPVSHYPYFGWSVAGAGDVNGDGYGDVIVGAIQWESNIDPSQDQEGGAFIFHGGPGGIPSGSTIDADRVLQADQAEAHFGWSVAGAGDVNGDGYADVIVGALGYDAGQDGEGTAFLFLGSPSGVDFHVDARLEADQVGASLGSKVAGAGDLNGDGFADVAVAAPGYDAGQSNEGAVFVYHGSPSGIANGNPATAVTQLEANQVTATFGHSLAGAGDVNGDGFGDLIVGAPLYDTPGHQGAAFVFHGSAAGISDGSPATAASQIVGNFNPQPNGFADSVAAAGDVNGDGYADVIVGWWSRVLIFLGSASGVVGNDWVTAAALLQLDAPSSEVASAGDVNGDGFADVIIAVELYGADDEGAALIYQGSGAGRGVRAQQLRSDSDTPIQPWGRAHSKKTFRVRMQATHPEGRGRVKLRIEYCPAGVAFGHASCGSKVGASWTDVGASGAGVTLTESITGLVASKTYRWRAAVLHAPFTITQAGVTAPVNPLRGPWRRVQAQAVEADVRTKGGLTCGLGAELALLLLVLGRRRRRSGGAPD